MSSIAVVRLPPMDLIRTFVAVGRRMSITLGAEDMCVTQSAVSRQISALEDMLGVKLFMRGYRSISFTTEGERLFSVADSAVRQLQEVVGAISIARDRRPVTVTASIGVSGLWLLPRMGRFQQRHPDIDIRISANNRLLDLRSEGIDLAIRYCPASAAPKGAVKLFGESLAPVAHPSLCSKLDSPHRLAEHFLLEFDDMRRYHLQWPEWLTSMGWSGVKPKGVLRFNQYDQVIQAAVAGQGIALGRLELLGSMLADGRLAVLSTPRSTKVDAHAYWLVQADPQPREDVLDVAAWIRAEAQKCERLDDGRQPLAADAEESRQAARV
jgi:LysR family transcriptional regulator, glycine cleavage system transcriptional activator